jgi:hypothetical protein
MLVQQSLLLDVDGVVFRHREISGRIGKRTCDLVQRVVQCSPSEAKTINKQLYSHYGHTYIGLKNIYKTKMTLREYNEEIYDPRFLESLMNIKPTSVTQQAKQQTEQLLMKAMSKNMKCYFYSNAPYIWLEFVMNYLKPNLWIHNGNWIHSQHEIYDEDGSLKPSTQNYTLTDYYLRHQFDWHAKHEVLYVDDSNVNVWQPSIIGLDWSCYHLTQKQVVPQSEKLKHLKSLKQLTQTL